MKICKSCGAKLKDNALYCSECGEVCRENDGVIEEKDNNLVKPTKIFLIIGSVILGLAIIPLFWCIPMVNKYYKCIETGKKVPLALKICTLLFCSTVAGILMLCDKRN